MIAFEVACNPVVGLIVPPRAALMSKTDIAELELAMSGRALTVLTLSGIRYGTDS